MAYDRNLLKIAEVPAFRAFLESSGIACRDGKGEFQLLQVHTSPTCWAVINRNTQGELTTHPELAHYIRLFRLVGKQTEASAPIQPAQAPRNTFLEDLRDDIAMAAMKAAIIARGERGNDLEFINEIELAKRSWRIADVMLETRKSRP